MSNKPEANKVYALTGGPGSKCIANGNTWADSEVKPKYEQITKSEWAKKPKAYKSIIDGQKYILALDPKTGGTILKPVDVIDNSTVQSVNIGSTFNA